MKKSRLLAGFVACAMVLTSMVTSSVVFAAVDTKSDDFNREIQTVTKADVPTSSTRGWGATLGGEMFKAADWSGAYVNIDDAYIEGLTGGAGKLYDDGYLHMHAGFYPKSETELTTPNGNVSVQLKPTGTGGTLEKQYMHIKMQVKVDDIHTKFSFAHKINNSWYGGLPEFSDGNLSMLGKNMKYEPGQWYYIVIQYEKGATTRTAWVNGQEIAGVVFDAPFESMTSFQVNMYSSTLNYVSDAYLDNVEVSESDTAFDPSAMNTALESSSTDVTVSGGTISLSGTKTAAQLKSALTKPDGAQLRVTRGDQTTQLEDDDAVTEADFVFVEAADGITLQRYQIGNTANRVLAEDLYNRSIKTLTSETPLFNFDQWNAGYTGFGADSMPLLAPKREPKSGDPVTLGLADGDSVTLVSGLGKAVGDRYVSHYIKAGTIYTSYFGSMGNAAHNNTMSSTGQTVFSMDFYYDGTQPDFQYYLKLNNKFPDVGFKVTGNQFQSMQNGTVKTLAPKQWYQASVVLNAGMYDLYLDGELVQGNITYKALDDGIKPTTISTLNLAMTRPTDADKELYFDNVRIYDTDEYIPVSPKISVTGGYLLEDAAIKAVTAGTTITEFMEHITLPEGAYCRLLEADGATEAVGDTVKSGQILAVYTGYATKIYTIDSSDTLYLVKSDYNDASDFTDITNALPVSGPYNWEKYYGGTEHPLTKSAIGGVQILATNGTSMLDGETVSIKSAPAKPAGDTAVRADINALGDETITDTDSGMAYAANNLAFYSSPNYALSDEYDLVYEYDIRSEDLNAKTNVILKFNGYGSQFYSIGLGKEGFTFEYGRTVHSIQSAVEAKRWYHVAFVQRKNSGLCDVYIDGKKCLDGLIMNADEPDKHCPNLQTITIKVSRGAAPSTLYIDNVQYYQYVKDYAPVADTVSSDLYTIEGRNIRGIDTGITAGNFELTLPSGASMRILTADELQEVSAETLLTSGMKAAVTLADGSIHIYRLWIGATPYMPQLFKDGMVLQRNQPVTIWGETADGTDSEITVTFGTQTKTAVPSGGRWTVTLDAMEAASEQTLVVSAADGNTVTIDDVAVGEVWICAGQSNMDFRLDDMEDFAEWKDKMQNSDVRVFSYPQYGGFEDLHDVESGSWVKSSMADAGLFSAIGYVVGQKLEECLDVPIALIMANKSGTAIEAWLDETSIEQNQYISDAYEQPMTEVLEAEKQKAAANPNGYNYSAMQNVPAAYYHTMIAPIANYGVKGVLWYQGCSNASGNQTQYKSMFQNLTALWRTKFQNENMPFVTFQLAPYASADFRSMRQTQLELAQELDNVYLISTANEGYTYTEGDEATHEIHPWRKSAIALRAAHTILCKVYNNNSMGQTYSSPMPASAKVADGKVEIVFTHTGTGLVVDPTVSQTLQGFEVSGNGETFVAANAEITADGTAVLVWSDEVPQPTAVRYAYKKAVIEYTDGTTFDCEDGDAGRDTSKTVARTTLGGNLTNDTGYPAPMFVMNDFAPMPADVTIDFYKNTVAEENRITAFDTTAEQIAVTVKASPAFTNTNMAAIAAVYSGNVLTGVSRVSIAANDDVTLILPNSQTNTKVQVFIWEQDTMQPYGKAAVLR